MATFLRKIERASARRQSLRSSSVTDREKLQHPLAVLKAARQRGASWRTFAKHQPAVVADVMKDYYGVAE